ncbi:MAG TPA: HAD family hydrolase [Gaiellaceae bacterium]|nr:HAD family hydrolase [Gaiellaceae bacterium]
MSSTLIERVVGRRMRRGARPPRPPAAPPAAPAPEVAAAPSQPFELDTISARWQLALDAAERAVRVAGLPDAERQRQRRELDRERAETAALLRRLATVAGVRPAPWLSPVPVTTRMLGLPPTVKACLFDLDGVLTDSGVLHAWAWGEVFDGLLLRMGERTGWHFIPFDRDDDYRTFVDGRSRLEGVHAFLGSRGIRLPEGRPDDPADADTACGLATRKGEAVARGLQRRGVAAMPGARRYLEAAGHVGLARAVVSASTSTLPMLRLAALDTLVEARVDADVIHAEGLRSRPAPDLPLAACARLGVRPSEAVAFTKSAAGVAAGRVAGIPVIGVADDDEHRELLEGYGAERVVPSLGALLDPVLADHRDEPALLGRSR